MNTAKHYLDGLVQLYTEAHEMDNYYHELNLRQDEEHNERFAAYTEQQYLEEQVYGPKQ